MSLSARFLGIVALASAGLFGALFTGSDSSAARTSHLAHNVNLALRRTAHILLRRAGDSTSLIPPVTQQDTHTFTIHLDHAFEYGQLPALLQESLRMHAVDADYDVAVLDCAHGTLQLGYNVRDMLSPSGVPCVSRRQAAGCYNIQLTVSQSGPVPASRPFVWLLGTAVLLIGVGYLVRHKAAAPRVADHSSESVNPEPALIRFGQSSLHPVTHALRSGATAASLTYREAKLLRYFVEHPNQILERERILKAVWEDEGITVDRSIDVFVSRLRKLLQHDPTLRLAAVYGVGYRLEIQ